MSSPTERLTPPPPEVIVTLDAETVERFAELTGDRSALHTDAVFARRSMYRQRVAHGMLPILFLSHLDLPAAPPGRAWRVRSLAVRFQGPAFIGDTLTLRTEAAVAADDGSKGFELSFTKPATGARVTACRLEVAAGPPEGETADPGSPGMVLDDLVEQDVQLADIRKGEQSGLRFRIGGATIAAAHEILGDHDGHAPQGPSLVDLLGACLTSTIVGMCRPGRPATYTDLTLGFTKPLETGIDYDMTAVVRFISSSTQMIAQDVTIAAAGDAHASGKFNVKVNAPAARMPTMEELERDATDLEIRGKTVLVTGASRGIGETIAKLFAVHGAKVFVNYAQSEADAERVAAEICSHGGWARTIRADVSNEADVARMFEVMTTEGGLDVLVNNAVGSAFPINFAELPWQEVQRELDVSLKGAFLCARAAAPLMKAAGAGRIINLSSVFTEDPPAGQLAYVVAKSALVGLTRSLAIELATDNILVNLAVAGFVDTDLGKHVTPVFKERIKSKVPLRRLASPTDVAKGVLMLASSMTAHSSGSKIMITGGSPPFV